MDDDPNIVHLACMAHARRPFTDLVKIAKKTGKSHQVVALIKKLYAIEKQAREEGLTPEARYTLCLKEATPILEKIKVWLEKAFQGTPPKGPKGKLGKAIQYIDYMLQI